jgi:hypothetical protein
VANTALRQAMADARMTEQALARAIGVDEKTVGRWVVQDDRIPNPRHRWAACEALGVDEAVIWPDAIRTVVKTGPDREIAAVYPYRSACPASLWRKLITNATREITLAGYTSYFLWIEQPNLCAALRRKAEAGCKVRFVIGSFISARIDDQRQRSFVTGYPGWPPAFLGHEGIRGPMRAGRCRRRVAVRGWAPVPRRLSRSTRVGS